MMIDHLEKNRQLALRLAALLGATGVTLGALGAHAWQDALTRAATVSTWETAVTYHLFHAAAMLAVAGQGIWWLRPKLARQIVWLFGGGVVLFSGTLYALALGAPKALGLITPLGGLALISGWVCLGVASWRKSRLTQAPFPGAR